MWLTKKKNPGEMDLSHTEFTQTAEVLFWACLLKKRAYLWIPLQCSFFFQHWNLCCCTQIGHLFSINLYLFMWDRAYPTTWERTLAALITLFLHLFLRFSNFQPLQLPYQYQFSVAFLCPSSIICLGIDPQLLSSFPKYQPHTSTTPALPL